MVKPAGQEEGKGHLEGRFGEIKTLCRGEQRDCLDFSSARSVDKDSTPPAWNEFVSRLFLFYYFFFLNAGNVSDVGGGLG